MTEDKEAALRTIEGIVSSNNLSYEDVAHRLWPEKSLAPVPPPPAQQPERRNMDESTSFSRHFNAPRMLYSLGAIIIYIAINIFLGQAWNSIGLLPRLVFTVGIGGFLWWVSYKMLSKTEGENDKIDGLSSAFLLTGSLSVAAGVFIFFAHFLGSDFGEGSFLLSALVLGILSSLLFGMDMLVKRVSTGVLGALALVGVYGALVSWPASAIKSTQMWGILGVIAGALLIAIGYMFRKANRDTEQNILWALGGASVFATVYGMGLQENLFAILWQLLMIILLYGAFVLSIKFRSKNFLFSGAFFLFLFTMTMAYKYFGDGLGAPGATLLGGTLIIGTGFLLQDIKRKYFE